MAHTETLAGTYLVDPRSLATLGRVRHVDEGGVAVGGEGKTAHPCVLPGGDVINLAADFLPVPTRDRTLLVRAPPLGAAAAAGLEMWGQGWQR